MEKKSWYSLIVSQVIFFIFLPLWTQVTTYLNPFVIAVVWFCYSFLTLFTFSWMTKEKIQVSSKVYHLAIFIYSVALFILLFFRPDNHGAESVNFIPFETVRLYLSGNADFLISVYNLAGNIGLFIPYGLYYRYMKKKQSFIQLLLLTIGSISIIEVLQFSTQRGSLDVDDLILNVLGVSIGYGLSPLFHKVIVLKK